MTARELWTAQEVADFLGLAATGPARGQLSRWGIRAVEYQRGENGRPEARYDAEQVRTAKATRPGRGARTDIAKN